MFQKLLSKLRKCFKFFSPKTKEVCDIAVGNEQAKSKTMEKQKNKKRRTKKMADEKVVKEEEVKTSSEEQKDEGVSKETEVKETEKKEEKVEEKGEIAKEETKEEDVETEPTAEVQETEAEGNGVRVEELVTKDLLAERLAAFEAKLDAVIKENQDLKEKLSQRDEELDTMKDKYENKDFGNFQRQGVAKQDKAANSSFDEYSKQFM